MNKHKMREIAGINEAQRNKLDKRELEGIVSHGIFGITGERQLIKNLESSLKRQGEQGWVIRVDHNLDGADIYLENLETGEEHKIVLEPKVEY